MLLEHDGRAIKYLTLLSGGMDSAVLLYDIHPTPQIALSISYGQTHIKEINYARNLCSNLGIQFINAYVGGISGGSITGTNNDMTGAATVVPGRNGVFLSIAANVAVANKCNRIAIGCNASDSDTYEDCHRTYLESVGRGIAMLHGIRLCWPFISMTKKEIRSQGIKLNVPFDKTWSCYRGGNAPCERCGACIEVAKSL